MLLTMHNRVLNVLWPIFDRIHVFGTPLLGLNSPSCDKKKVILFLFSGLGALIWSFSHVKGSLLSFLYDDNLAISQSLDKTKKNGGTLLSSTFKIEENKVLLLVFIFDLRTEISPSCHSRRLLLDDVAHIG